MTVNRLFRQLVGGGLMAAVVVGGTTTTFAQHSHSSRIEAFETNYWRFLAPAGEDIEVTVEGDGDTDLDCRALDRDGQLLASDTEDTDFCVMRFAVPQSGFVQVRIDNLGDVWNAYEMRVASARRPVALPGQRLVVNEGSLPGHSSETRVSASPPQAMPI
jgi:hypothetical protein